MVLEHLLSVDKAKPGMRGRGMPIPGIKVGREESSEPWAREKVCTELPGTGLGCGRSIPAPLCLSEERPLELWPQ